jgi:hypothetical protein
VHHLTTAPGGVPLGGGQPARSAPRSRLSWIPGLPLLARTVAQTMPWVTLLTGCLAGGVYVAVMAHFATPAQPLGQSTVRLAFLPAVAALAFVPRAPFRPLIQTTPVPAWVASAGHVVLAAPVLAVTCWAQLRFVAHTIAPDAPSTPVYPLIAQLTGWCAVAVAVAACVDRSRYADLGGAVAAPVSFAAIALAWFVPAISKHLAEPPAGPHGVTIAWYAIAAAALALAGAAMRDQWHRYLRVLRRRPGLR